MTNAMMMLLGKLEGCACVARSDAQTLLVGCERRNYFADVARYNLENIEVLCQYVRELQEMVDAEMFQYRSIEEIPF